MSRAPVLAWLSAALLLAAAGDAAALKCLPIYGNWCGPEHPRYGSPPPVDAFAAAGMRHDICTATGPDTPCDIAFVNETRSLAAQLGYLPRPLQWAEYVIRLKAGGPAGGMPAPAPGDLFGLFSGVVAPWR